MTFDTDYAVVFSGGGALGAWEVGCFKAIFEIHSEKLPKIVTGASAGALNAASLCAGLSIEQLEKLWVDLKPQEVFLKNKKLPSNFLSFLKCLLRTKSVKKLVSELSTNTDSFFNTEPLEKTLRKIFSAQPDEFIKSTLTCAISLTDLSQGNRVSYYHLPPGGKLPDKCQNGRTDWREISSIETLILALMGTTALPLLFPPFNTLFDGGVLHNQPISSAISLGAKRIYVVIPSADSPGRTRNLSEILSMLLNTWLASSLLAQIDVVKIQNKIYSKTEDKPICLVLIRPQIDIITQHGVDLLAFGKNVEQLISSGYKTTKERLSKSRFNPENQNTWY